MRQYLILANATGAFATSVFTIEAHDKTDAIERFTAANKNSTVVAVSSWLEEEPARDGTRYGGHLGRVVKATPQPPPPPFQIKGDFLIT